MPTNGAAFRVVFHRFRALEEYWKSSIALPIRDNFPGSLGRRVRFVGLLDVRKRVILPRGADFRAALKVYRDSDPQVVESAPHAAVECGVD